MTAVLTADPPRLHRGCRITEQRNGITDARLHLIDLDNLHCGPYPTDRMIELVRSDYEQIGPLGSKTPPARRHSRND